MGGKKKDGGYTLIELIIALGILSILTLIAMTRYQEFRIRAYDKVALSDLKNALTAVENYHLDNGIYPDDYTDLLTLGFNFSPNVCFTKFHEHDNGMSVHIHVRHTSSPNAWHTRYPEDAGQVDHRGSESCL